MANALRALAMDAVEQAKSGHPGMPMGMADIATVLFSRFLKFDPTQPDWPDRDRFVLSNGHGSMLLYGLLHLTGYADMTIDELKRFRQLGSQDRRPPRARPRDRHRDDDRPPRPGHRQRASGWRSPSGCSPREFGDDVVNHRTYVFCGDGCLMEGISHEALSLAGHYKLNKLTVLWDDNSISIDGPTSLAVSDDQIERFAAHGWATERVDGHDPTPISPPRLERAQTPGPAEPHRLQDDHRLWRADQGRHRRGARGAARRRGDQGRARTARLGIRRPS